MPKMMTVTNDATVAAAVAGKYRLKMLLLRRQDRNNCQLKSNEHSQPPYSNTQEP